MMPKNECFVGIDTSNYTTSVAVSALDGQGKPAVVANIKYPLPVKAGERGLRQSDAVFAHVRNLPLAMDDLKEVLARDGYTVSAVGYSATPRDAQGSYMPCFLAGKVAASALCAGLVKEGRSVPAYAFSHQNGHIMAALYSSGALFQDSLMREPFLAFHVSGGTTEALLVKARDGVCGFDVTLVGEGADLHAGQVIDRTGVMMGLDFPCGRAMEELAKGYLSECGQIKGIKVCVKDGTCHLSGLENIAERLWKETKDKAYVSAYVLSFVGKTIRRMTEQIQEKREKPLPVVYAGGVMSNQLIRPMLSYKAGWQTYFCEPAYSADNAAGISLLCLMKAARCRE